MFPKIWWYTSNGSNVFRYASISKIVLLCYNICTRWLFLVVVCCNNFLLPFLVIFSLSLNVFPSSQWVSIFTVSFCHHCVSVIRVCFIFLSGVYNGHFRLCFSSTNQNAETEIIPTQFTGSSYKIEQVVASYPHSISLPLSSIVVISYRVTLY